MCKETDEVVKSPEDSIKTDSFCLESDLLRQRRGEGKGGKGRSPPVHNFNISIFLIKGILNIGIILTNNCLPTVQVIASGSEEECNTSLLPRAK